MEIMKDLDNIKPERETAITIGVFDGVHLGHQSLLRHLNEIARRNGLNSVVITFKSHPEMILNTLKPVTWLDKLEIRISKIQKLGIDYVIALSFSSELSRFTAKEFMQLLKDCLKLKALIIGPDFALGRDREGNAKQLSLIGEQIGFSVEVMPPLVLDGEVVSSSLIRQTLAQGDLIKSTRLLGQYFSVRGEVVSGNKRGRTLGFPTANLEMEPEQFLLPDGVYATITYADGQPFPSVTNIGTCPTFSGGKRVVETHVIDRKLDLLGKHLRIDFVEKLRDEQCFESEFKLKTQISKDIDRAKTLLSKLTLIVN
jgi:riboflavin kinase / FMN adenylyltransferase